MARAMQTTVTNPSKPRTENCRSSAYRPRLRVGLVNLRELHHSPQHRQAGVYLLVAAHGDAQAVGPAGVAHVAHQDAIVLELFVERLDWQLGVRAPDEVRLRRHRLKAECLRSFGQPL